MRHVGVRRCGLRETQSMIVVRGGIAALARCGVTVLALWAATATAAPRYRISEVPEVPGMRPVAVGINDLGVVVGTLHPANGSRRVFRWREGRPVELAPQDNPKLEQFAMSVDHLGAVSYHVSWPGNVFPGKFLRTEVWGRRAVAVKKLSGVYSFFGNTEGDLIIRGDKRDYALREREGTQIDIVAPDDAQMFDLNNLQQVVGTSRGHPVRWSRATGLEVIPALQDEPLVAAKAINDRGDVALMTGPFELARDDPNNAPNAVYLWNAETGVQPLGTHLQCAWYRPQRIGPQGTVVGDCYAEASPLSDQHAFAGDAASGIYLLRSRIDPADPLAGVYWMFNAVGINRSGQILVEAWHKDERSQRLLVLTPVR
jgi:hypothetical protein